MVRLVSDGLLELNVVTVFLDAVFDLVLDFERAVSISWVGPSDWHDPCGFTWEAFYDTLYERIVSNLASIENPVLT